MEACVLQSLCVATVSSWGNVGYDALFCAFADYNNNNNNNYTHENKVTAEEEGITLLGEWKQKGEKKRKARQSASMH